jgi:CrcB protein
MGIEAMTLLMVAAGGALGGMSRLAVGNGVMKWLGTGFPWGTLVVNLSGAFLMGLLVGGLGLPDTDGPGHGWGLLAVGLLGGYTTVSSFSLQTFDLWQQARRLSSLVNVLVTLGGGLFALSVGWWLARGLA